MTKEDAIGIIKSECYVFNPLNFDRSTMVNTALDMAVKALSEEPYEDAISRKEVIETIEWYDKDRYIECSNDMIEYIKKMPSVKPQYNEAEIQKMQELEQAQLEKAYEIGKAEQTEIGHCKECKYFECDSVARLDGIPLIVAHEICSKWGTGCKTRENGYCFLFEPQESEES